MYARIFSPVVCSVVAITALATFGAADVAAQTTAGYYTDPATGIVYREVTRTIERPVVETKMESREQTVYRPQTVTETTPRSRTVYTPVVEYNWEPRVTGRWNPFRQPTVAYHHVGRTLWERRNETVQRTTSRTEWVAEKRVIDIPQRIVKLTRQREVEYEPVGQVAPQSAAPPGASEALASRLRPLDANAQVLPLGSRTQIASSTFAAPRIASSTVAGTNPSGRSLSQSGMQATTLYPTSNNVPGQALPPSTTSNGVATLPPLRMFR